MRLSVVIPVYNEAATIREIVRRVQAVDVSKELILVDDFSTDGAREALAEIAAQAENVKVLLHERNRGKGRALRTGFDHAAGDFVIVQDADLEYDPQDYPKLLASSALGASGCRVRLPFPHDGTAPGPVLLALGGNRLLTLLSNMATNLNLTDMETCYKVFRRELIQSIVLEEDRFGFEPEITSKIAKAGARVYEVGISYHGRTYGEGKKIGAKDGFRALWCIVKYRLKPLRRK